MRFGSMENQSIFTQNNFNSFENFCFDDEENAFFLKRNEDKDYYFDIKSQPKKSIDCGISFTPEKLVLDNQRFDNESDVCQHGPDVQIDNIDTFVETKEVSVSQKETGEEERENSNKKPKKGKTTEFAYLLERKSFRMMRKYYKEKFEDEIEDSEYKKKLPTMSCEDINILVNRFLDQEVGSLISFLTSNDYERTRDALKTIIF